jgi:D-tyrosyl-tRNA(Tyr) deacylase
MKSWNIPAKFVLISSTKDPASINIKESIINEYGYLELIPFNENEKIYKITNEIIIFETDVKTKKINYYLFEWFE